MQFLDSAKSVSRHTLIQVIKKSNKNIKEKAVHLLKPGLTGACEEVKSDSYRAADFKRLYILTEVLVLLFFGIFINLCDEIMYTGIISSSYDKTNRCMNT